MAAKPCIQCVIATEHCARCKQRQRLRLVAGEAEVTPFAQQRSSLRLSQPPIACALASSAAAVTAHMHELRAAVLDSSASTLVRQRAEACALRRRKAPERSPIVPPAVLDAERRVLMLTKTGHFEEAKQLQEEVVAPQRRRAAAVLGHKQAQKKHVALAKLQSRQAVERQLQGRKATSQLQMLELEMLRLPHTATLR